MSWGLDKLPFDLLTSVKEGLRRFKVATVEEEVCRGNIQGSESFSSYGRMVTGGAVSNKVIWPDGTWTVPPVTGINPTLVSTSISDGIGGTGIRSVEVHYLNTQLEAMTETVILNGTTPVTMIATNVRFIQCLHMVTYGSNKAAVGSISLSADAIIYSFISVGDRRCSSSARMVPKGKRWLLTGALGSSISGTAATSTEIFLAASMMDGHDYTNDSVLIPMAALGFQDGSFGIVLKPYPVFPEGCVVGMMASTDKSAIVTGTLFGYLENVPQF